MHSYCGCGSLDKCGFRHSHFWLHSSYPSLPISIFVMEPVDAVVREAVLHAFAAAAPNAAPFPPPAWEVEGEAVPQQLLLDAQAALGDALNAAYSAGLDPSLVAAAASAAGAAYAAGHVRNRIAAAALHNDDDGPNGPEVLLPLADDVLVHFVNRIYSDR